MRKRRNKLKHHASAASAENADPQKLFQQGEAALKRGNLDEAEHAFRAVLAINPQIAGAYANLGVTYMRRKQWTQALEMLHKAQHLAPEMAGVRLNIGLVYYRQNDFRKAIPPFESVVHDAPDSFQGRYLLGCATSLLSVTERQQARWSRCGRRLRRN